MVGRGSAGLPAPSPHEVVRERLLEVLHRHAARPLLLLVAPAGFGKSTLAAAYARNSGAAVAWLTLHPGDRDARFLFSRVADTLEAAFDDSSLLPRLHRGLLGGAEGVGLARLLAEDLAQAPSGLIVVLDDFHALHGADEVIQAVDALVRMLPEGTQLVVTAREPPPLSMTRLVASEAVFALGIEDLRFTVEESAALRRMLGRDDGNDAAAEGWVAGILLGGAPRQLGMAGGMLLGRYVEREVLARLTGSEQRWLETLAVLETIAPAAAERLLGKGPWPSRLAKLADRCPFLVAEEDGRYRLHALVRNALLDGLRRASSTRATRAWTTARALAEEAFDIVGVVRACQELGESEAAVGLVRRAVDEAMQAGRWAAALATLDLLPEPARRAQPDLSLAEAHALVQLARAEPARQAAESALQYAGRSGDPRLQIAAVLELANIARFEGDVEAALDWLSAADYLLRGSTLALAEHRRLEGRSLGLRGVCLALRGRVEEARDTLESAERILSLNGTSRELAVVLTNLGAVCWHAGENATAKRALAGAITQWRLIGDRVAVATTQTTLGSLYLREGDLEPAGATFASAAESARVVGIERTEGFARVWLGQWHRLNGRISEAVAALDEGLRLAEDVGERELLIVALRRRAEVAILQEDFQTARTHLARAESEAQLLGSDLQVAGIERARGRLHLSEGALQMAVNHLEGGLRRGQRVWPSNERVDALYWLGTAQLLAGRTLQAEETLRQVVELSGEPDARFALTSAAAEDGRLLSHGVQAGIDPLVLGEVERVASAHRPWIGAARAAPLELVARHELPRIEVRLLGRFALYRDGQPVEVGGRVDRARELLALLVLHPHGMADREIAARLWDDMPPQRALHNLQMTAYLLRRLLGSKAAVRHSAAAYQLAPQLELWADTRAFDAALERSRRGGEVETEALERAVELYRGPLLDDAGWAWVEESRAAYQHRFVGAALRLAEMTGRAQPSRAEALLERVLGAEPENEAAYELLIRGAVARGNQAGARRIQARYRRVAGRLGVPPNPRLLRAGP